MSDLLKKYRSRRWQAILFLECFIAFTLFSYIFLFIKFPDSQNLSGFSNFCVTSISVAVAGISYFIQLETKKKSE